MSTIPSGVTVTYSGTTYTGTMAASASTVNKIYMVWNGTAYDMYGTSQDGGYSWVPMGTTTVDLSQYATKAELSQLEAKLNGATLTPLTLTEVSGKYIGFDGSVNTSYNYAYTEPFYVEKGKQILVHARGYSTVVAMISKVITEDTQYQALVSSIDSNVQDYICIAPEDGYYAASFNTSQPRTVTIIENSPAALADGLNKCNTELADHETRISKNEEILIGAYSNKPEVSEITGQYIGSNGDVAPANGFAYTEKFYVEKGQLILVNARGYNTAVAMISKVVTEGTLYIPVAVSVDSNVHNYTYIAEENGYYAASFSTSQPRTITVSINTPLELSERINANIAELADHETRISTNESLLVGATKTILTLSETTGKYIGYGGEVAPANGFGYSEPFYVEKGKMILVTARGYSTNVAMISKVVTEDSLYIPLVISIDSSVHDYQYITEESGYYATSFSTSQTRTTTILANIPLVLSERIGKLEEYSEPTRLQTDLYFGVPVVGMIGDSLMSRAGYDPNTSSVHDNIEFAWWKVLERKSGMTYRRFCRGGMSTFAFVSDTTYGLPVALTAGNECNLYIVGLEINDRNNYPNDLGTSTDIDLSNPDNNANTFYGNYGKIIQKITSFNPGCKFILFTNPRTDGSWNDAIREIAGMFSNCYLVDLWELYSEYFTTGGFFDKYKDSSAHYPAMAYQSMAKLLERAVDDCINDNYTDFRGIQYQG